LRTLELEFMLDPSIFDAHISSTMSKAVRTACIDQASPCRVRKDSSWV
jgi:hypothetical protein